MLCFKVKFEKVSHIYKNNRVRRLSRRKNNYSIKTALTWKRLILFSVQGRKRRVCRKGKVHLAVEKETVDKEMK